MSYKGLILKSSVEKVENIIHMKLDEVTRRMVIGATKLINKILGQHILKEKAPTKKKEKVLPFEKFPEKSLDLALTQVKRSFLKKKFPL